MNLQLAKPVKATYHIVIMQLEVEFAFATTVFMAGRGGSVNGGRLKAANGTRI